MIRRRIRLGWGQRGILGWVVGLALVFSPVLSNAEDLNVEGSISTRYRFRTTGSHHDSDLTPLLTLDIGDAQTSTVSGALQAGGIFDLDSSGADSPFGSVYDTWDRKAVERIYYAYADVRDVGCFERIRLGRQHRSEFENLYFDGATVQYKRAKGLQLTAFGGIPVHLFETSIGDDPGDWLVGGALELDPVATIRFRVDYAYLRDEVIGFRAASGDQSDNLLISSLWWDVAKGVMLSTRFSSFIDQVRDFEFGTRLYSEAHRFTFRVRYYTLLKGYDIRVLDLDRYVFAGTYQPYFEAGFSATKELGDHFSIDGGFSARYLDEEQVASAFNHGYNRVYLGANLYGLLTPGTSFSLVGDYYNGQDNVLRNDTFAMSFSAAQELLEKKLKIEGGTGYYLYRYNLMAGNESSGVRTYYVRVKGKIYKQLDGRFGYEFEDNDFDNFHTIDTRVTWNF